MSKAMRTAVVTGGSRGIGAEVARRLAHDGFRTVVNYSGSADAAQSVVDAIASDGGEAIAVQADIGDAEAVSHLFDQAAAAFGGVDVVVNNAGVMTLATVAETSDEAANAMISTNVVGTFNVCRQAARQVRDGGSIINLSTSVIGLRLPTYGIYIATKAAVEGLTQVLAQELRGREIRVNAVAPGPTTTELFLNGKSDELLERMAKMNPLERL
ncbi:hypothetical protein LTR94_024625, partial [Friedmanniomyces endolithicus]